MSWVLRRIIPEDECPGTCCKKTPLEPDPVTGVCIHFDPSLKGRKFGGCSLMTTDGKEDVSKSVVLNVERKTKFQGEHCIGYPIPDLIPAKDTKYPTDFGRGFFPSCECWEWEKV